MKTAIMLTALVLAGCTDSMIADLHPTQGKGDWSRYTWIGSSDPHYSMASDHLRDFCRDNKPLPPHVTVTAPIDCDKVETELQIYEAPGPYSGFNPYLATINGFEHRLNDRLNAERFQQSVRETQRKVFGHARD